MIASIIVHGSNVIVPSVMSEAMKQGSWDGGVDRTIFPQLLIGTLQTLSSWIRGMIANEVRKFELAEF